VPLSVSVIIPSRNEEEWIGRSISSAWSAGAAEVIVANCGSTDGTAALAEAAGARVLSGSQLRAEGLNRAARSATSDALIFLHADTILPGTAAARVTEALAKHEFGGFRIRFAESDFRLRVAESLINLRTTLTRCPWGDQAQFIGRERFLAVGGFREIPIMEDYEMAVRMKRLGQTTILGESVTTSGRRFLQRGILRTTILNWRIVAAYRRGVDPGVLAKMYR